MNALVEPRWVFFNRHAHYAGELAEIISISNLLSVDIRRRRQVDGLFVTREFVDIVFQQAVSGLELGMSGQF